MKLRYSSTSYWARLQSCEKNLLFLLFPSARLFVRKYRRGSHMTDLTLGTSMKRAAKFVQNRTKILATLHEHVCKPTFNCCRQHKPAIQTFLCNAQCFYVADSDMHIQKAFLCFSLKEWLRARAIMLRSACIAFRLVI